MQSFTRLLSGYFNTMEYHFRQSSGVQSYEKIEKISQLDGRYFLTNTRYMYKFDEPLQLYQVYFDRNREYTVQYSSNCSVIVDVFERYCCTVVIFFTVLATSTSRTQGASFHFTNIHIRRSRRYSFCTVCFKNIVRYKNLIVFPKL